MEVVKPLPRHNVYVIPHPAQIPFFGISYCLFSTTDLCLCPKLPYIPLGCIVKEAASWRMLCVWRWKSDLQRQSHWWFPLIWFAWTCTGLELGVSKLACWSSQWVFFPFSCDNVSISGWQNATWDDGLVYTLSFDGGEQLPNGEHPENVSSCCSENYSFWLLHWELLSRKQPPLSTTCQLYKIQFNDLWG